MSRSPDRSAESGSSPGSGSLPVFSISALPDGDEVVLDGPEGKHAATVRRLRTGAGLMLSDGQGRMARCTVVAAGRDSLRLSIRDSWYVDTPLLRVRLAQALVKGSRGELAIELATEAGIDAIVPWRASRCVARWEESPRTAKALARWRDTAAQASKQARRAWTPPVDDPVSTRGLAEAVTHSDGALVLHESAGTPLSKVEFPDEGELVLVVGPEGGITDQELDTLSAAGARPVRLGPTVLRASTAAAVALGSLGVLTDRWSDPT